MTNRAACALVVMLVLGGLFGCGEDESPAGLGEPCGATGVVGTDERRRRSAWGKTMRKSGSCWRMTRPPRSERENSRQVRSCP